MDLQDTKFCRACQQDLPLTSFWKNRANTDGLQAYCKVCLRAKNEPGFARYRQAHAERLAEYQREYRRQNPEKLAEVGPKYRRTYYLRHKPQVLAATNRYRQAHIEQARKSGRDHNARNREARRRNSEQYRLKNLLRYREHASRRRALERSTMIEPIDFRAIYKRDNGICHICQNPVPKSRLHFDHVIPLAKGGTHTMDNLKVAHGRCNMKKSDRLSPASATV